MIFEGQVCIHQIPVSTGGESVNNKLFAVEDLHFDGSW